MVNIAVKGFDKNKNNFLIYLIFIYQGKLPVIDPIDVVAADATMFPFL